MYDDAMFGFRDSDRSAVSWLSGSGAFGGFLAFIGASCCVVPILLVHLGVASGLVAKLGYVARWQEWFAWGGAGLLALSLTLALSRGTPGRVFWIWWGVGVAFLTASIILPNYEMRLQFWLLNWLSG
ncbi:MAG: hypothetical protein VX529_08435 [Pseudomonadota bacterium]|nr:hypothetical protein [Pseudomonadota bacterium]